MEENQEGRGAVLKKELLQSLMIGPTAMNVFISIASVVGVIEFFGPVLLYVLDGWREVTRGAWDWLFVTLGFKALPFDFIKDALTHAFFLFLFALSSFKALWIVIRSESDDPVRRVEWNLFPLALFISSTFVGLLIMESFRFEFNPEFVFSQFLFITIFYYVIFSMFAFVPLGVSYLFELSFTKIKGQPTNSFKIFFNSLLYSFAVFLAWFGMQFSEDPQLTAGWLTFLSFVMIFAVPMMVPIMQPRRMLRLAVYVGVLCLIGLASYSVEYIRQKTKIQELGAVADNKSSYVIELKTELKRSCDESDSTRMMGLLSAFKPEMDLDKYCQCMSVRIVENESLKVTLGLIENFDDESIYPKDNMEKYLEYCLKDYIE